MRPRFSVIIPTYNRAGLVPQAIDSALAQTFRDREVIVVDDGSTDSTASVLAEYGNRIKAVRQSNQWPDAFKNRAVQEARGEYLAFLDDDDVMFPFALEVYDQAAKENLDPPMIIGLMRWFANNPGEVAPERVDCITAVNFRDFLAKNVSVSISYSVLVVKRQLFLKVGGVRRGALLADDYEFMLRAGVYGPCVIIQSPVTVAYRSHAGSGHRNLDGIVDAIIGLKKQNIGHRRWDRSAYIGGAARTFLQEAMKAKRHRLAFKLVTQCGVPLAVGVVRKLILKAVKPGQMQMVDLPSATTNSKK